MGEAAPLTGPDLAAGVALADVPEGGSLLGHAGGEAVLLVRPAGGDDVFAVGATCTHYNGPLADGCVVGREVHCPWHHARFDVTTGDAVAPSVDKLQWVEKASAEIERLQTATTICAQCPACLPLEAAGAPATTP